MSVIALLVALVLAVAQQTAPIDVRARVERWREALELDLGAEVIADAASLDAASASDPELTALHARALHAAGDSERALELLAEARKRAPNAPAPTLALARIAIDHDDLAEVETLLRAPAGAREPVRFASDPEAWLLLGRARARRGDPAGAAPLFERFVALAPHASEAPSAWHGLIACAMAAGDRERAERARREAERSGLWQSYYRARRIQVRAQPNEPLPRVGLVELWLAANELGRAEREARTLVERWPAFARGHAVLGETLARQARDPEARTALEKALELDAALASAHAELAKVLRKLGDTQRADVHAARAVELDAARRR